MNFLKPISISLSPNTEKDDILLALKLLFQPWRWKGGETIEKLENQFEEYLGVKPASAKAPAGKYAISFNSGRSALMAILKSLDLEKDDEILLQAFTCNAAVNPIIWSGLKPVFVDCDEKTFNIDTEDLKKKLTQKSRAVMVQHTFGLPAFAKASAGKPADLDEILEICQKNNLIFIEDCAHSLGSTYKGTKVGNFGKAAFFSFGRDKIISSIYGGMAVTNDFSLAEKIRQVQGKIGFPSYFWIFQQLLHPILINYLILPLYGIFEIGRLILIFFQKMKILSKAISNSEKKGKNPTYFPKKLPNALAILALNQFRKLGRFVSHQKEIAKFYDENLQRPTFGGYPDFVLPEKNPERVYMRYSLLIKNEESDKILKKARKFKIFLDDGWRKTPITPPDTNQKSLGYIFSTCPKAEKIAKAILNLPTHINISKKDAQKVIDFLKSYGN